MHIALAADGDRVSQALGNEAQGLQHLVLTILLRGEGTAFLETERGKDRGPPGSEVLCREVLLRNPAQIIVDLGRTDRMADPLLIDVLEQVLTGQVLAASHDSSQASI